MARSVLNSRLATIALLVAVFASCATAQWVSFANETGTRLSAPASLGATDSQEKDYAWGDVDQDGDTDLVVVRKQPFTSSGRRVNVLLMNVGGVLTDQTSLYATASNVAGSSGFNDLTNDRDVQLADLDGDGWLDIVTATTLSGSQPKYISHPRVYINLGNDGSGNWQGFLFDDENRFPTMPAEPRFCSVSVGDIDGDGDLDVYMGDYQQGGFRPIDLNDRLFINDGTGYFTDESSLRMSVTMLESSFAMATEIADMNGDGKLDIIKDDALNAPQGVSISYNDTATHGFFGGYDIAHAFAPYHVTAGDLNNDGMLDMVVTDDGSDRFTLNTGNNASGIAQFSPQTFSFIGGGNDDGFGGNNLIVDLDNDGWKDVIITDVDVDISGCNRRCHIYRNLGPSGTTGGVTNVNLQEQQAGGAVCNIPTSMLVGSHDAAVFDINGDGYLDMVLGRCTGTQVWMNEPPVGVAFSYPNGLPFYVSPGTSTTFTVKCTPTGVATLDPNSATLHTRQSGGNWQTSQLTWLGGNDFQGTLTASNVCTETTEWYVSITDTSTNITFSNPDTAPGSNNEILAANGTTIAYQEGFENGMAGWTVTNGAGLIDGAWELAEPNPTFFATLQCAPGEDAEASTAATHCWVTKNGPIGGGVSDDDVDGGPTTLTSPVFDFNGTDGFITYSRWFVAIGAGDSMVTQVTSDGSNWVDVETLTVVNNSWEVTTFRVGDYVTPTATVQVRFVVNDFSPASVVEAAMDSFRVELFDCGTCQTNIGYQGPGTVDLAICGGDLSAGTTANIYLSNCLPNNQAFLFVTTTLNPTPILSGVAITTTPAVVGAVVTDSNGEWVSSNIPGGIGNFLYYVQAAEFRNDVPGGLAFSNASELQFLP